MIFLVLPKYCQYKTFWILIYIINNFNLLQLNKIGIFFCWSHWKYVSDNWSLLTLKVEGFGISRNMRTHIFNAFFLSTILQYVFYVIMQGKIICNAFAKLSNNSNQDGNNSISCCNSYVDYNFHYLKIFRYKQKVPFLMNKDNVRFFLFE